MDGFATAQTRVRDLKRHPAIRAAELGVINGLWGFLLGGSRLGSLNLMFNADDPASMIDGFNAVIRNQEAGLRVCHHIYSDEEIRQDPAKREVTLHYFPAGAAGRGAERPFMLICPGGGYTMVASIWEGYPVAGRLSALGFPAFVLRYRSGKAARYPNPQDDLGRAVGYILERAAEFGVRKTGYGLMGFSAGGHLAATFGLAEAGFRKYGLPAPAALALAYPVVSMGEHTHQGSRQNLLGKESDLALVEALSVERQVDPAYPPTYLWHCEADSTVPIINSTALAEALERAGVPCKLKRVPGGRHGLSLALGTDAEGWLEEAVEFWQAVCA
ncbi:MAG: alpha/beta hydrolase [Treponema sp.]|nr:alpha/beta hydrolase [Treponema sp.]